MKMTAIHPTLALTTGACAALLSLAAPPTWAQGASAEVRLATLERASAAPLVTVSEGPAQRIVKGAPYCADAVQESVQWLADPGGAAPNRIVRSTSMKLCRDGEGRTRQETGSGDSTRVLLHDPTTRESWVLDPARKTARRMQGAVHIGIGPGAGGGAAMDEHSIAWREYADRMRQWARETAQRVQRDTSGSGAAAAPPAPPAPPVPPTPPMPPTPPVPAVITSVSGGPVSVREEVRVLRLDGASGWTAPPSIQFGAQLIAPRGPGVVTALPAREMEGVRVNGERTTWTVAAGQVGNERPIVATREVWTSPDLMLTVMSRDFDPRRGETNYRLQNIRRGEPDAALFKVPADFTTQPAAASGARRP